MVVSSRFHVCKQTKPDQNKLLQRTQNIGEPSRVKGFQHNLHLFQ